MLDLRDLSARLAKWGCCPADPGTTTTTTAAAATTTATTTTTSSTAQGGGGSFKNRKPIGEVGCCESGMAERSH